MPNVTLLGSLNRSTRPLVQPGHQPSLGRLVQVFVKLMAIGDSRFPDTQFLIVRGFSSTVTISGTGTPGDNYTLVVSAPANTFTYTLLAGQGNEDVVNGLVLAINASNTVLKAVKLSATSFSVHSNATFTIANTGSTVPANITPSSVGGAAPPTANATTVPLLTPLTERIEAGNVLMVSTGTADERLITIAQSAEIGDTSLICEPLLQDLVAGSFTEDPGYVFDRTSADIEFSASVTGQSTFNSGGNKVGVQGEKSATLSLSGLYQIYNGGLLTCDAAYKTGKPLLVYYLYPPAMPGFTHGGGYYGFANVTSLSKAAPVDGLIDASVELEFSGEVLTIRPA